MNAHNLAGWTDTANSATWRIDKPAATNPTVGAFLPDQNGGVYEKLLQALPVAMHCMDGSGRLIAANPTWLSILGYGSHEIVGRSFSEFLTSESRTHLVTNIYPKYLVTGSVKGEELMLVRKGGGLSTVIISMAAYRGDKGRLERSICTLEDITEKKVATLATARGDQRFRTAFSACVHGMAVVSPTGQIEFANDACKEFLGRKDLTGTALTEAASWTALARALLNLDEFITRE